VDFSVTVNTDVAASLTSDLRQILDDLGLVDKVRLEEAAQQQHAADGAARRR
jgi:hypothetical protein